MNLDKNWSLRMLSMNLDKNLFISYDSFNIHFFIRTPKPNEAFACSQLFGLKSKNVQFLDSKCLILTLIELR